MKTPDELIKEVAGDQLPDDLKWIMARFKMEPTDPVFLLLAWHWRRLNESQDRLHQENLAFKAIYETGTKSIQENLAQWQRIVTAITQFQNQLTQLTQGAEKGFQERMQQPVDAALTATQQLTQQLNDTIRNLKIQNKKTRWHLPIACLLAGLACGAGLIPWTFSLLLVRFWR